MDPYRREGAYVQQAVAPAAAVSRIGQAADRCPRRSADATSNVRLALLFSEM